jgi:cation transport ATPase
MERAIALSIPYLKRLAGAIIDAANEAKISLLEATNVAEVPGEGLRGTVSGRKLLVTSRNKLIGMKVTGSETSPPVAGGLECVVAIDERFAATLRFRDAPRAESPSFIKHLGPRHQFNRVMIVSGDRVG